MGGAAGGAIVVALLAAGPVHGELDTKHLVALLKTVDERQRNAGDWRQTAFVQQKAKGQADVAYEIVAMRRSEDHKFLMLFTEPKASRGQGYLRIDRNLWFYDPAVGRWERRTEREHIGGTNSRRSDFDESHLAEEYDPEDGGEQSLGIYTARVITLKAKPGLDLAFPMVKIWVDARTENILKREDYALSGRMLRTTYYPKWLKIRSDSKKGDVYYPHEIRLYDELEKGSSTLILIQSVDARPLDPNIFTKAWLEGQSR